MAKIPTTKTKRKAPTRKLGSHPLQELTPANDAALQESVYDCYQGGPLKPRPFYQTPPGGEPVIPHEPPRMTIDGLADEYKEMQQCAARMPPWIEWYEWQYYRGRMV